MVFRAPCAKPISSNGTKSTIPSRAKSPCLDRKSTRLNSSHSQISYAVFCLKKKTVLDHPPRARVVARTCHTDQTSHPPFPPQQRLATTHSVQRTHQSQQPFTLSQT